MAIDMLVLGIDGVLFDTETAHWLSCNHALNNLGLDAQISIGEYRSAAFANGHTNGLRTIAERLGVNAGNGTIPALLSEKSRLFHDRVCRGGVTAYTGCVDLIYDALRDGCKLAIVTELSAPTTTALLEQVFGHRLNEIFAVVASEVSFAASSHNSAYSLVLRTAGINASDAVAIQSSMPALLAAQRSGLRTLAIVPDSEGSEFVDRFDGWYFERHMAQGSAADGPGKVMSFAVLDAYLHASKLAISRATPGKAAPA